MVKYFGAGVSELGMGEHKACILLRACPAA